MLQTRGARVGGRRSISVFTQLLGFLNPQPQLHREEVVVWESLGGNHGGFIPNWRCVDDSDYGGKSHSAVTTHTVDEGKGPSFIRVSGAVVEFDDKETKKVKGGFCAILGNCRPVLDLRDCSGLQITMRSSQTQTFTVNLKSASLFEDDMYQIRCELAASSEWRNLKIPFEKFQLTARGMEREYHRANDSLRVESLGFLFKEDDMRNGQHIQLDIKRIAAYP